MKQIGPFKVWTLGPVLVYWRKRRDTRSKELGFEFRGRRHHYEWVITWANAHELGEL